MKKRKVIITKLPQAKSGVEVKLDGLRAGLGYNANVLPWPVMAGKMSAPDTEVRKTLGPVPRHMANLEAEKDEIAMIPGQGGIPSTFIIGGKRHHSGGTPLFLPSDSFIFSDTAKMRIKDPEILKQFGMTPRKGGYTPAEIAKKYDVNEYKKILADPNTDDLQRETAELMIANCNLKLAKLAIYQESMKGFPQGMPQVGMPYIEEMGIDPAQFVQENPGQGEDETAEADNMSRFGGPHYAGGGSYKFNEFSPNAGAGDAYQGVEGVEGKPLTGQYQDWETTAKKKTQVPLGQAISTGLGMATAIANAPQIEALKKKMFESSLADKAITAVDANKGFGEVQTGMATGLKDPTKTGVLTQQSMYGYTNPIVSTKFGGDIDYFAPGGYLPKATRGGITPQQAEIMYKAAMASKDPDKMEQVAKTIAAVKSSKDKWWSGAWNPLADEWDFDKYEDLLTSSAKAIRDANTRNKNYQTYKSKYWTEIYPHYRELEKRFEKDPMGTYSQEELDKLSKMNEVFAIGKNLRLYEEAKQAEKKGKAPSEPVPFNVLTSSFDPNLLNPYHPTASTTTAVDASQERGKTFSASAKDTATTVTPADNAEALKQQEAVRKELGQKTTQPKTETTKPAVKKQQESGIPEFEWSTLNKQKEGGTINGKRRVLIHSLGEYKMGGALKSYQEGGKTTETKKVKGQTKDPNGKWHLVYDDNTVSDKSYDHKFNLVPYKGKDHPTQYNAVDWLNFAVDAGFEPTTDDPTEQAKQLQRKLWDDPKWGPTVKKLHAPVNEGGFGTPKAGVYDDGYLGERWEQLLKKAPKKEVGPTPPVKDDKTKTTFSNYRPYAEGLKTPKVPSVPPHITIQDALKLGNLGLDYLGIKGFYPWSAKPNVYLEDYALRSPERQYAKIGELYNTAAQNLATFGNPQQYNARLAQLTGEAMKNVADVAANVEGENVRTINQNQSRNASILNQYAQNEAARLTSDWDKYQTVNENIYNQRRFGRDAITNQLANSFSNMANIYNLNQLYPQYAVNPAGMLYFKNPRAIKGDYSKQKTVVDYYNQILEENEHLRNQPQIALKMAESMAGVKPRTDQADEWLRASKGVIPSYNVNPYDYGNEQEG